MKPVTTEHGTGAHDRVHTYQHMIETTAPGTAEDVDLAPRLTGPYLAGPRGAPQDGCKVMLEFGYPVGGHLVFIVQAMTWIEWSALAIEMRRFAFLTMIDGHITTLFGTERPFARKYLADAIAAVDFDTDPRPWQHVL